ELNLLNRSDVQKDLGLTNDQITKVEDYIAKSRPQRPGGGGAGGGGNGGGGGGQRQGGGGGFGGGGGQMTAEQIAEFQKQAAERRAKTRKELLEIISEAQLKRVDEINLQINGYMVLSQPAMQETLGFTAEQKAKVADLQAKQREANQGLFQKMRDQEIAQEDFRAAMTKNNDVMKAELGKILTAEQAEKFKAMQGKPFTADDN
ncbi:MAG TPA: hypothetical protein VK171_02900, partial [Fimbriimonas sp.]|nr:hypothetical protein [Fimbriimonas sp.]